MSTNHLNEHDANQGAQSSGEFLGMTGNSGWYLLGSGGATILMVTFLWGIFGVSLLLCLFLGILLCLGSVGYVFTLKNGKPEHYDSDFFESALVEAGVMQFRFGPRLRRPVNPFTDNGMDELPVPVREKRRAGQQSASGRRNHGGPSRLNAAVEPVEDGDKGKASRVKPEPMVTQRAYDAYVGAREGNGKGKNAAIGAAAGFAVGETINFFSNKAQRDAFLAGYEKGQSNAVKQQYWIARDNQRPSLDDGYEEAYYEITVPQSDRDGVRREATKRVIRVVVPKQETGS